jgi:hypothetical protein
MTGVRPKLENARINPVEDKSGFVDCFNPCSDMRVQGWDSAFRSHEFGCLSKVFRNLLEAVFAAVISNARMADPGCSLIHTESQKDQRHSQGGVVGCSHAGTFEKR